MFTGLAPMNPGDALDPFRADFSLKLGAGESVAEVVNITASPDSITIGSGSIVDGANPQSAVVFPLSNGIDGVSYEVAVTILSTSGVTLTRTMLVTVRATT